jgi:predicted cupin superfamily sugar epimerase
MPVDPIPGRSAAEIIRLLDLQPHPEGGFFRETFRDPAVRRFPPEVPVRTMMAGDYYKFSAS